MHYVLYKIVYIHTFTTMPRHVIAAETCGGRNPDHVIPWYYYQLAISIVYLSSHYKRV